MCRASRRSCAGSTRATALLKPDDFVPSPSATGLIRPLTMSVLRVALKQSRDWNAAGTR